MVREAENPSWPDAACCKVDVVNGGPGLRLSGLPGQKEPQFCAFQQLQQAARCLPTILDIGLPEFLAVTGSETVA